MAINIRSSQTKPKLLSPSGAALFLSQVSIVLALSVLMLSSPLLAQGPSGKVAGQDAHSTVCPLVEVAARDNALPIDFFTRLIWTESRFRADAIGPLARSGERAEGIAQFMPYTALEQHVDEPFDPARALQASG